jgi:hypothetical protein
MTIAAKQQEDRRGQLIGVDSGMDHEQQTLHRLVSEEELVVPTLERSFGGRQALFIALWRSRLPAEWQDIQDQHYLTDQDILEQRLLTDKFASQTLHLLDRSITCHALS